MCKFLDEGNQSSSLYKHGNNNYSITVTENLSANRKPKSSRCSGVSMARFTVICYLFRLLYYPPVQFTFVSSLQEAVGLPNGRVPKFLMYFHEVVLGEKLEWCGVRCQFDGDEVIMEGAFLTRRSNVLAQTLKGNFKAFLDHIFVGKKG